MAVRLDPQPAPPSRPLKAGVSRVDRWLDEMFRENAMMDEATRYTRQFLRGGGQSSQGANIVIVGIMGLLYLWFLAVIIRYSLSATMPIQYLELFFVTVVIPASMYTAISGEREKATWDALALTRLTPAQIIVGKMAWRIAILAAIMAVMLVGVVVSQIVGRDVTEQVTWSAVLAAQVMIFAWGALLCAFSLWVSAHTRQSVTTISGIVASLLIGLIGVPTLLGMFNVDPDREASASFGNFLAFSALYSNPFLLLYQLTGRGAAYGGSAVWDAMLLSPEVWAFWLAAMFLLAAAWFVRSSHARLRRLEEPVRAA